MKQKLLLTKFLILLTLSVIYSPVNAQKNKSLSFKIIKDKPSVFITFDRKGKQPPLFEGESENRIWLRLHNNTKLKLFLCTFDVDKEYGITGVFYDVEKVSSWKENKDIRVPNGYGRIDVCNVFTLLPGQSILFSIPNEHLSKGLAIRTNFFYGWTGNWKEDIYEGTRHSVAFGSDQLVKR